jgi:hypothetical protein
MDKFLIEQNNVGKNGYFFLGGGKGAFQIVALNNPIGIIRSVENTNGVPLRHPVGMHPYGMPTTTGTLPFLPSDSFLRNEQKRQFEMHPSSPQSIGVGNFFACSPSATCFVNPSTAGFAIQKFKIQNSKFKNSKI